MSKVSLIDQVRSALDVADQAFAGQPQQAAVTRLRDRLDEPLRVAIAGRVKAGKSTLLNALVGEELAPTDAGECTKIVTWFQDSHRYRVAADVSGGETRELLFSRNGGAIDIDLGTLGAGEIDRLVVEWPSQSLRTMTLIDTPGIASAASEVSERTHRFLESDEDEPRQADAVIYLMRHLHGTDLRFLEAFHDDEVAMATPVNAIGVLSRADEIGVGRLSSMDSADRVAARYRQDPKVRRLCQTIIPVAGLLAETGATLTQAELAALSVLAETSREVVDDLLISTDRFVAEEAPVALTPIERRHLLERLGVFGIRLGVALVRQGVAKTASDLSSEYIRRSGLIELKQVLAQQFGARRDALKARSALLALEALVQEGGDMSQLAIELERIRAGAHEFAEIRLLNAIRTGSVEFGTEEIEDAERLLTEVEIGRRVGVSADADEATVEAALISEVQRWRMRAESPLSSRGTSEAAGVLVRTCEGLLATLST